MDAGRNYGIHPAGLDALDVCRIEAGFVMAGVDYVGAHEAVIESQKSTPYELGLGWTVKHDERPPFIGADALAAEKAQEVDGRLSVWRSVGKRLNVYMTRMDCLPRFHRMHGGMPSSIIVIGDKLVGRPAAYGRPY